jgi:4-amino-4-deoxy-L-arabinose transferase-like glycosyltransferase
MVFIRQKLRSFRPRSVRTERHLLASLAAVVTIAAAAITAPAVGISRDEGTYFAASEMYAQWWADAIRSPGEAFARIDSWYQANREHPGLAKLLSGLSHAAFARWLGHIQAFRIPTFLFAGLLSYLLLLLAHDLTERATFPSARIRDLSRRCAALLAPALFWLVPRHFYHAHPAVFDMPVASLWLATVYAYWRSLPVRGEGLRVGWAVTTGLAFGAAVSVKHNGWFLPPLLFVHWLFTGARHLTGRGGWRTRLRAVPLAFPAMAVLGPLVFVVTWPWLWRGGLERIAWYFSFHANHEHYSWHYLGTVMRHPPFPMAYPFVVTALTVPAGVLAAMFGGLVHSVARAIGALRGDGERAVWADELLLTLNALFPIVLIAHPQVPHFGGVKHWLAAMPFLAALGARALMTASHQLWPRPALLALPLAVLILVPAAWATGHFHPFGTAAYNELAGGAGGAATLGMQRQFWGDNMVAALEVLNQHAAQGARVWYQEATVAAVRTYQRDGRLRSDLTPVETPEEAQISVYHYHQEFRDKEFRTWTEFQTTRPVHGVYLDEVPLITIYARAGAWR